MKKILPIILFFLPLALVSGETVSMVYMGTMSTTRNYEVEGVQWEQNWNEQLGLTLSCFSYNLLSRPTMKYAGLYGSLSLNYIGSTTLTNVDNSTYAESSLSSVTFPLCYNSLLGGGYLFDNYRQRIILAGGLNINGILRSTDSLCYHSLVMGPGVSASVLLGNGMKDVNMSFYLGGAWNMIQVAQSEDYTDYLSSDYDGGTTLFLGVGLGYHPNP
ncbi:MAG: hypothetical protein PQJ60_14670 [Spirochaetales bacterium]|nr:hypothetical protein [Spirochaetales bacterium]